jgi:hypothetical protein
MRAYHTDTPERAELIRLQALDRSPRRAEERNRPELAQRASRSDRARVGTLPAQLPSGNSEAHHPPDRWSRRPRAAEATGLLWPRMACPCESGASPALRPRVVPSIDRPARSWTVRPSRQAERRRRPSSREDLRQWRRFLPGAYHVDTLGVQTGYVARSLLDPRAAPQEPQTNVSPCRPSSQLLRPRPGIEPARSARLMWSQTSFRTCPLRRWRLSWRSAPALPRSTQRGCRVQR